MLYLLFLEIGVDEGQLKGYVNDGPQVLLTSDRVCYIYLNCN